jgi:hypothetical protein
MAVSATQLRQNIYAILDEALATGKPIEIERKGKVLRIVPDPVEEEQLDDDEFAKEFPRLAKLKDLGLFVGTDDLANLEWSPDFTKLVPRKPPKKRP